MSHVSDHTVLSKDFSRNHLVRGEMYSNLLDNIHDESNRLEKTFRFFCRYYSMRAYSRAEGDYIYYVKVMAYFANQQMMSGQGIGRVLL